MNFNNQITRILDKLKKAKSIDSSFKVFGASSHQYEMNEPVIRSQIRVVEKLYNITLPECYKAFILHVGNSGNGYGNSAAGPFYGIYPFGKMLNELCENPTISLQNPVLIDPEMSRTDWEKRIERLENDEEMPDEEYDKEMDNLFGGILPIGSQGCTYLHGILLNGKHKGKIVNLDIDLQQPVFCYEDNFLDWYERWLDEVIAGDLLVDNPTWFGYSRGGTVHQLIDGFLKADDKSKMSYLVGLLKKATIGLGSYIILEKEYLKTTDQERKKRLLQLLYKTDSTKSKDYLIEHGKTDLLTVFQFVFWYAKEKCTEWIPFIEANIHRIEEEETFRFCSYVLEETKTDIGKLMVPFTKSKNEAIRKSAYYILGKLDNKSNYLETFIYGLSDESNTNVRTVIQALNNVNDPKLIRSYKELLHRFPEETDYILVNLKHRLEEMGLEEAQLRAMSIREVEKLIKERLKVDRFKFWRN